MLSAGNAGIVRAAIHMMFVAALICAAPLARAVGGGCTAGAHTFCVTNTSDTTDPGSLRTAITNANTAGGTNTIGFNIPGGGVHTIALVSTQLPAIATDLTIDGFSQPGSVQNTNAPDQGGLTTQLTIEIVGIAGVGFSYECCGGPFRTLTFQGLALRGFNDVINGQSGTTTPKAKINVYGCFIGTKVDGTALATPGNGGTAVRVNYDNAQVGGTLPWQRNLLSGNAYAAVFIAPYDATSSVVIEGNLIGTDAGATQSIPNGTASNWGGIYVAGAGRNVRIGCTGAGCASTASRNIISGNNPQGIFLAPDAGGTHFSGLEIKGNYIGLGWNGAPLPNQYIDPANITFGGGLRVAGAADMSPAIIGGFGPGEANTIAFNHGPGINGMDFFTGAFSYFDNRGNKVHDNIALGQANVAIGASNSEPLANDAGDPDTGSNNRQNSPEILTAEPVRGPGPGQLSLKVTYKVTSTPVNALYPLRVDFHFAVNGGTGLWFATDNYPDSAGQGYVTATVPITLSVAGPGPWYAFWGPIVAIATSASGYSSEISPVTNDWIFGDGFE
jgi:hypothetical protein